MAVNMKKNTDTIEFSSISPKRTLELLSPREVSRLRDSGHRSHHDLLRKCALAILNVDAHSDNAKTIFDTYPDFDIEIVQQDRGLRLNLRNAPANAFVDGEMIASTREMLFSALRDIVYSESEKSYKRFDLTSSAGTSDYVFHLLRNAKSITGGEPPGIVVCWGGHSINDIEYQYTKLVGHELGLRGLDICTGCGPGAMKGPMKGATIAHAKQRVTNARYLGMTEPGIIAAEPPNPIVNELVIMPDIEKRLEAFVRIGHAIIIFPGGVGTAEELLYLLGIMLHPNNQKIPFTIILTGPKSSADYFEHLDRFIGITLGPEAQQYYDIIVDDAATVAKKVKSGIQTVMDYRYQVNDAYHFNWQLTIDLAFQSPFEPTHENIKQLTIDKSIPTHELAANLRRVFSSIVAGNVKENGIKLIETHGPYQIRGDKAIMAPLDQLLRSFIKQQRMKLPGTTYSPCYELVE